MSNTRLFSLCRRGVLSITFVLVSALAQAQETYPIQLDRPLNVGDRYSFSTVYDTRQVMNISSKGMDVQKLDSTFVIRMQADVEVTEARGATQKVTIRQCSRITGGDTVELVPAGTLFTYRRHATGSNLTPVGYSVDDETLTQIDDAFPGSIHRPDNASVGTPKPQKIGASWKIDSKKVAGELGNSASFKVEPKDLYATGTLASVTKGIDSPFMTVVIDLSMNKFKIADIPGFKLAQTTAKFRVTGDLPLDESKGPLGSTLAMTMNVTGKGKPDPSLPEFELEMSFVRNSRTTYTYGK